MSTPDTKKIAEEMRERCEAEKKGKTIGLDEIAAWADALDPRPTMGIEEAIALFEDVADPDKDGWNTKELRRAVDVIKERLAHYEATKQPDWSVVTRTDAPCSVTPTQPGPLPFSLLFNDDAQCPKHHPKGRASGACASCHYEATKAETKAVHIAAAEAIMATPAEPRKPEKIEDLVKRFGLVFTILENRVEIESHQAEGVITIGYPANVVRFGSDASSKVRP